MSLDGLTKKNITIVVNDLLENINYYSRRYLLCVMIHFVLIITAVLTHFPDGNTDAHRQRSPQNKISVATGAAVDI